jgi:hypothetical protein
MRKRELDTVENVTFSLQTDISGNQPPNGVDVTKLMSDFHALEVMSDDLSADNLDHECDVLLAKEQHYDINYNVKQLSLIHEYYGLGSVSKKKKADIIMSIIGYEDNDENAGTVARRNVLWHYIDEIKDDPVLCKYMITP